MTYLKTLITDVEDWLEDEGDEDEVIRAINRAVEEVETYKDWEVLKDRATVTPDSSGIIRDPATSRVIRRVFPEGNYDLPEFQFRAKSEQDTLDNPRTHAYKLLSTAMVKTQLSDGLLVDVTQNSQTVVQATASTDDIDTSWVGERFMIEDDETIYEITEAVAATSMTVFPDIRRETGSAQSAKVRPLGMSQYKLTDYTGTAYTQNVEIAYQTKHPALVGYNDQLFIPARQTVYLLAVSYFLHQTKYDVDARQLKLDIMEAKNRECNQEATASPEHVGPRSSFSVRDKRNNRTLR
jgi:hypothetical protein